MTPYFRVCLPTCLFLLLPAALSAETWHVDAERGDDTAAGTELAPFRSLMHIAKRVNPGDTVLVHPGIYFEHVKLERAGTAEAPITFRSTDGPAVTTITGAHRELREKRLQWETVSTVDGLHRVPLPEEPATLLCDEVNLYRYPTLAELCTFTVENIALQNKPGPGPRHGYAYEDGFLYVRLHPDGKDGDTDPAVHVFKASPKRGEGFRGDEIDSRQRANFLMSMDGPAHVVLEGFTFESPGYCGVWVRHGEVVIRDCRFIGCRTGVRGWDRPEKKPRMLSDNVIIERCEFTEHPTYADVAEIIEQVSGMPADQRSTLPRFYWWHRKAGAYSAEIGLVAGAGRRWIIRDNHIHDTFDGLSFQSLGWSEDCIVSGNRFERIVDNAVEAEEHPQRLTVRNNVVVDCFEPFSCQTQNPAPWPTSVLFEHNTVTFTDAGAALWGREDLGWKPGCVKIYVLPEFTEVTGGLVFRSNLIWFPTGPLLSVNQAALSLRGVRFEENLIAARGLGGHEDGRPPLHYEFSGNDVVPLSASVADSLQPMASNGTIHASADAAGIMAVDAKTGQIQRSPGSLAARRGTQ